MKNKKCVIICGSTGATTRMYNANLKPFLILRKKKVNPCPGARGGQKAFHTIIAKNYQPPRPEFCTDELFGPGFAFSALSAKSLNRHWSTTDIIIKLLVYWACSCCCCKNPITACCCFRALLKSNGDLSL